MENEIQIREVVDKVLSEEGLKNFIKIFEKEHNLFRGSHEKMAVPPAVVENYYTSEYLNERLWELDGANLYYEDGWVGVGKKPDVPLDVLGNTNIVGAVGITGNLSVLGDVSLDGAAFFNESGLDKDFRIESLNDEYAFFLNAAGTYFGFRESNPTALVHIHARAVDGVPALNLEAGANGEIVTPDGQVLRIGHWNSGTQTFTERMKMDSAGKIFISYLSTGCLAFAGVGGEIKQDANLVWDNSTKKLGINTTPTEALTVAGKLRLEGTSYSILSNYVGAGREILILRGKSTAADGSGINLYGAGDSASPGQIKFFTNNITALTIDTSQLVTIKDLSITTPINIYNLSHDLFADYLAAEHLSLPNTLANVLSDHNKAAHDALGIDAETLDTLHASSFALTTRKLDDFGTPDDNTDLNASLTRHGLLLKLGGGTTNFLRADGTWAEPPGGGVSTFLELTDTPGSYAGEAGKFVKVNATPDGLEFADVVAGDLPSHNHNKVDISDFWDSPFWASIPDKPSTYPPSSHGHVKDDITDTPWSWDDVLKTGASLADLPTRSHADLQGVTSDLHHPQSHSLASHSTKAHSELTGVTADLHHAQLHETAHRSGGGDALNHDLLAGFVAAEHKSLPNTIAQVLSDHNLAAHTALGLFDQSSDVDHDLTTNYVGAEHLSLPNTIANVLSNHTKAIHDSLGLDHAELSNVLSGQHHAQLHAAAHHVGGGDLLNHDSLTGFVANEHINHGSVSMIAGSGLSGGGTIAANRTFNLGLLTAAWDAGSYQIRALKFYSDQAPGVAPFTVLSTTKVTNLNADRLEGYHGAEISTVSTVAIRDSSGDIKARLFRSEYDTTNPTINYIMTQIDTASNNYIRPSTPAQLISALNLALTTRKLDDFGTPDDNTDLDASTSRHGLLKKLGGGAVNFLRADGAWAQPSGGASIHSRTPVNLSLTKDNTWRDVDVTAYTSASATFVLIKLHCEAYDGGTYSATLQTREKGETLPNARVGATSTSSLSVQDNSFVICKLDASQIFQYKAQTSNDLNTNLVLTVIGWIE